MTTMTRSAAVSQAPSPCAVLLAGRPPDLFSDAEYAKSYSAALMKLSDESMSAHVQTLESLRVSEADVSSAWVNANHDSLVGLGSGDEKEIGLARASVDVLSKALLVAELKRQLSAAHVDLSAALARHSEAAIDLFEARSSNT